MSWPTLTIDEIKAPSDRSIAIGPFGSRMKSDQYVARGVPVIRGNNLIDGRALSGDFVYISDATADELQACNVYADDLVFPHRGAIGEVGIVPRDSVPRYMMSTSLMKLTCNRNLVEPQFVYYFFKSPHGRQALLQRASTVGTPGIGQPLTSLRSIQIPVPPLSAQRAIVNTLGSLDDKIELNRQMSQTLEEIARTLFKSWFVDFDPVHAKAAGRQPVGMDAETAALFPSEFDESELGLIPKGWHSVRVGDAIEINPSRRLKKNEVAPYLDMSNMPTVLHNPGQLVDRAYGSGARFQNGDTLLARITPCLENGKTAYMDVLLDNHIAWGSTEYIVLCPVTPIPKEFAYLLARSEGFRAHAIQSMSGSSGRQRVSPQAVSDWRLALPSPEILASFGAIVRPLMLRVRDANAESQTLASIRDNLLPRLISGELLLNVQIEN